MRMKSSFISSALSSNSHVFFTRVLTTKPLLSTQLRMSHNTNNKGEKNHTQTNKKVDQIQHFLHPDPIGEKKLYVKVRPTFLPFLDPYIAGGGWEECWKQGLTPWDLGKATPVLLHLHRTGALPKGRALIPGCGSGHDVVAIACPERYVVGVDISENAIQKAKEFSCSSPNADSFTFLKTDFFTWQPTELFDLIFDYTFFCAIEPDMRSLWASKVRDLLKPDGELITLIFPISDHEGGPPYKVSVANYEEVLHPMGFKAMSVLDNELAVAPRRGREKLARWKRFICKSLL